jgi:hypothetical protein
MSGILNSSQFEGWSECLKREKIVEKNLKKNFIKIQIQKWTFVT